MNLIQSSFRIPCGLILFLGAGIVSADTFLREETEVFDVQPGQTLEIDAGAASIHVEPGPADQVTLNVVLHVKSGSQEKADEIFENTRLSFDQSGSKVKLDIESGKSGGFLGLFGSKSADISVTAQCPPQFNLRIDTGSGEILVEQISGNLVLDTGSGSIQGQGLGGSVYADTGSGSVVMDGLEGQLQADTGSGSISVAGLVGSFNGDTGSGSIKVAGSLTRFLADTGSGSIRIQSDIPLADDSVADTGSGSISVFLPLSAQFHLRADSASGNISCSFPGMIDVVSSSNSFSATIGSPSVQLNFEAGSGDISVAPLP